MGPFALLRAGRLPAGRLALVLALLLPSGLGAASRTDGWPDPGADRGPLTAKEIRQGYSDRTLLARPKPARAGERAALAPEELVAAEAREGFRVRTRFSRLDDLRVLEVADGETAAAAAARLQASGRYESVAFDRILRAAAVPNDPRFDQQWALRNTGANGGRAGADISAPAAWDVITDAPNIVVAVLDSGARLTHPDLAPNLWRNPNPRPGVNDVHGVRVINGRVSGSPEDDSGHGTHVAGLIGAVGNNGNGIAGVAWRVQLMILKFLGPDGFGLLSDELTCLNYAIDNGAHIINASYGESASAPPDPRQLALVARARDAGIIYVAAAGNTATNLDVSRHFPASNPLDNVVAVGASTRLDDRATFSNYGSGAVELFAPGDFVLSLNYASDTVPVNSSGTSMAAPMVSGALALMKTRFPRDTYRQLINRLLRSTDPLPAFAGRSQTGGRLNLLKAVTSADNRPFNDDFANRGRLVGDNVATRGSNVGATAEPGEAAGAVSLWWEWTAPVSAPVNLDTAGSGYDTVLSVFAGTAPGSLVPVAGNDDDGALRTSRVAFAAVAGTTYQISVDGKGGGAGLTLLNVGIVPGNDRFAAAAPLVGRSVLVNANNAQTAREADEPRILGSAGGRSLWYRWTAPASGPFQLSLVSDDLDPLVAVYSGPAAARGFAELAPVAAGEALPAEPDTARTVLCAFTAAAGTTYYFTVDAKPGPFGVPSGQFTLSLTDAAWQVPTGDNLTTSPAVAADGTVYLGGNDGRFYAFNPDGSTKWATPPITFTFAGTEYPVSMDTSSAAVGTDGTVYFGASDGGLRAYRPDGTQKWIFQVPIPTAAESAEGRFISLYNSPALAADGTVYIKADDFRVYAVDPADGARKWAFDTGGLSYGSPVVGADGTVYVGSDSDRFFALNPDGTEKWRYVADGDIYTTAALDAAGNVYFATSGDSLYSLTPAGALRWRYRTPSPITSSPALSADGRTAYFGGYDKKLHAVDTATGTVRWTFPLGDEVRASSPAIDANGVVYVGCYDYLLYAVNPDGSLNRTYAAGRWVRSSPVIAGNRLYFASNDHKLYAHDLPAAAAGGPWPQLRHNARRTGRALVEPFVIAAAPRSQTVLAGEPLVLSVVAGGPGPFTYQWSRNGAAIAGATAASFTIPTASAAAAGSYTVAVTGPQGTLVSAAAVVAVEIPNPGRLVNLSVRTTAGSGVRLLTVGFALAGTPAKAVLLRGVGPTLAAFGVEGALADPQLRLYSGGAVLTSNDNWAAPADGAAALSAAFAGSGAFGLDPSSRDAALLRPLVAGSYTAEISGTDPAAAGVALAELYDTAPTSGARLVNVSARAQVGAGNLLVAGFSISGNVPRRVLIRAIGPALAAFGVDDALANPRLELYRGPILLQANDDWGVPGPGGSSAAALRTAFSAVGAFALADGLGLDAALLATLPPGTYTAQVSGVNNAAGSALIEVYEVP